MVAYSDFLSGQMVDYEFPAEKVKISKEAIVKD